MWESKPKLKLSYERKQSMPLEKPENENEDPKELVKELVAYIKAHVPDPHEPTLFELMQRVDKFLETPDNGRTDQEKAQSEAEKGEGLGYGGNR